MIKEIMLASSIVSNSLVPIVEYDLTKNAAITDFYISAGDIRDNSALCINLNDGTSFTANLVDNMDGPFEIKEIYNINDSYSNYQPINYFDYLKYIVNTYSPFHNGNDRLIYTEGWLDFYWDIYLDTAFNLQDPEMPEATLFFTLCSYDTDNNGEPFFFELTNDWGLLVSGNPNYLRLANIYFDELIGGIFELDNLYLVVEFREFYISEDIIDDSTFEININFRYDDSTYIYLSNVNLPNYDFESTMFNDGNYYTEFIYQSLNELESENIILSGQNDYLRRENEELNTKHALTNVFEIVRGAFDGLISFLEIELIPNVSIGTIAFLPVAVGVLFFILKALVL